MTRLLKTLCLLALLAAPASAERYSIRVKRLELNLYHDKNLRIIIETRYCYEYANEAPAILNWEGKYGNNWIIFTDGLAPTKCDVVTIR